MLGVLAAIALAASPRVDVARQPWPFVGGGMNLLFPGYSAHAGSVMSLLQPGGVATSPLFCTAARSLSLLSGSYACLNGDGTQDSSAGYTLSAVGSPTTQVLPTSPNGNNSTAVARQVLWKANAYYKTASVAHPGGDWWACGLGMSATGQNGGIVAMGTSYPETISLAMDAGANRAQMAAAGASVTGGYIVTGVEHLVCATYHSVGTGSVNVGTVYADGAQVSSNTTMPAIPAGSDPITLGLQNGFGYLERARGIAFGSGYLPSATDISRLYAALIPTPQTASGQAVSNSRNSASWVTTSDGTLVALPPGRTGVVGVPGDTGSAIGGVVSAPSRTIIGTYSEQLENAAYNIGTATATASTATGPNGALTADTVTAGTAGAYRGQAFTSSGGAASLSIYTKAISGTQGVNVQIYDDTSSASLASSSCTAGAAWARCTVSVASTTSGHSIQFRFYPAGSSGTGSVYAFGYMPEWSATPSPYCRSESTSATCSGDAPNDAAPSWLNPKEGCAVACFTPSYSGANPLASLLSILSGNTSGTGRLLYVPASAQSVAISDGTHTATLAQTFTSGARRCYRSTWSASAGTLTISDVAGGTSASATGFTGFASFDSTIGVGQENGGKQPLGAMMDSIRLGSSPSGCN